MAKVQAQTHNRLEMAQIEAQIPLNRPLMLQIEVQTLEIGREWPRSPVPEIGRNRL